MPTDTLIETKQAIINCVFIQWLASKGALDEYSSMYKGDWGEGDRFDDIGNAFNWDRSPSGYNFWDNLREEWQGQMMSGYRRKEGLRGELIRAYEKNNA